MHRVMMVSIALILVTGIARSTVAQPAADPEMLLGTLNVACQQQGNLAACVKFGVIIGSHSQRSPQAGPVTS